MPPNSLHMTRFLEMHQRCPQNGQVSNVSAQVYTHHDGVLQQRTRQQAVPVHPHAPMPNSYVAHGPTSSNRFPSCSCCVAAWGAAEYHGQPPDHSIRSYCDALLGAAIPLCEAPGSQCEPKASEGPCSQCEPKRSERPGSQCEPKSSEGPGSQCEPRGGRHLCESLFIHVLRCSITNPFSNERPTPGI